LDLYDVIIILITFVSVLLIKMNCSQETYKGGIKMNRKIIVLHRIFLLVSILILTASLVFYLIKWNSFPNEIGVHFDGDGQYDVVSSKFYGFYPHVVGGIFTAGIAFVDYLVSRKKTGLKISSKGESVFKTELILVLDVLSVLFSVFFANWSLSVSLQIPLDVYFMGNLELLMFAVIAVGIILQIVTCRKYGEQQENTENKILSHKVCRLIAWLMTVGGFIVLAVSWERLPSDEEFYFNPDYYGLVYFANFGVFLDKRLLLIPHIAVVILLIVLEVISAKAIRTGKNTIAVLTDKLKLINATFFFWWNMLLDSEISIGIVSVSIYVLLCTLFFAKYQKDRLKQSVNADLS